MAVVEGGESGGVRVSIIVPTRNEAPNIELLVDRLTAAIRAQLGHELTWELIFVDDSDDRTPAVIRSQIAAGKPVRLLHRDGGDRPGGLGGAVQDGFAAAGGAVVAVMDADLQHPPEVVPGLIRAVMSGESDLVSGSRYSHAAERAGLSGPWRRIVASSTRWLVHAVIPRSRALSDPMSGLFAFDRDGIDGLHLQANGFKILLEVMARGDWQRVGNLAYGFDQRHAGRSKTSFREGVLFARHLVHLAIDTRTGANGRALVGPAGGTMARR